MTTPHPCLDLLVQRIQGDPTSALDPRLSLLAALGEAQADGSLPTIAGELDAVLAASADEAAVRSALGWAAPHVDPPDGTGWLDWVSTTAALVVEALDDPTRLPASGAPEERLATPRASRFLDTATANDAVTQVLRRNESRFREWAAGGSGWPRQQYYADLGREVGRVLTDPSAGTAPARAVVVVMQVDAVSGRPHVLTAYPEVLLDEPTREAFPALCHLFGGYLGADHGTPADDVREALRTIDDPARGRLRAQLDELLRLDDVSLRASLEACGSYVLPVRARAWVEAVRWRLDAFPWLG